MALGQSLCKALKIVKIYSCKDAESSWQSHLHSRSLCSIPGPKWNPCLGKPTLWASCSMYTWYLSYQPHLISIIFQLPRIFSSQVIFGSWYPKIFKFFSTKKNVWSKKKGTINYYCCCCYYYSLILILSSTLATSACFLAISISHW